MTKFEFVGYSAADVPTELWEPITELNHGAVVRCYGERFANHPEVRLSTGIDDPVAYAERRINPERPNNLYQLPRIMLALDQRDRLAGVVWTAENTSGATEAERLAKMKELVPLHRWTWIGWVATHPDHQRRSHVATTTISAALRVSGISRSVSAYAWPAVSSEAGSLPPAHKALTNNGLRPVGERVFLPPNVSSMDFIPTQRFVRPGTVRRAVDLVQKRRPARFGQPSGLTRAK